MMERWELLCAIAVTCFSFSGALIMRMPREDRRTLFIFPIFLSVAVGGSLLVFGYERFGAWMIAGPLLVPIVLVQMTGRFAPGWLLTLLSYVGLIAAVVCADRLLEDSAFR